MLSTCKACGAPIIWIRTPKGAFMPADQGLVKYRENPRGKTFLVDDSGRLIHCDLEFDGIPTGMARIPHWATCTYSKQFKRKKEALR